MKLPGWLGIILFDALVGSGRATPAAFRHRWMNSKLMSMTKAESDTSAAPVTEDKNALPR
jgi:hypothetical protein